MNLEDRRFKQPFHVVVYRRRYQPGEVVAVQGPIPTMDPDAADLHRYEIHTIADQRLLAEKLVSGEFIEGPPLIIQYAELMALGCLELEPEMHGPMEPEELTS